MTTKTKILIGILIFIILVIGVKWLIWERIVTVTIDKTEFERGEAVEFTVKSDPLRPIYYTLPPFCPKTVSSCHIEQKKEGGWDTISNLYHYMDIADSSFCYVNRYAPKWEEIKIDANKSFSGKWNQKMGVWGSNEGYPAPPGEYRISCIYRPYPWRCFIDVFGDCIVGSSDLKQFYSREFRIKTGTLEENEPLGEEITITSPAKGEKWRVGEVYQIHWTPSNPEEHVVIQLKKTPYLSLDLVWEPSYSLPNTGSYSFTVPNGLESGKLYRFYITAYGGSGDSSYSYQGYSEEFSIVLE